MIPCTLPFDDFHSSRLALCISMAFDIHRLNLSIYLHRGLSPLRSLHLFYVGTSLSFIDCVCFLDFACCCNSHKKSWLPTLPLVRLFLNLWFAKPMVCVWVAFHENDEDNSDNYKQGIECWFGGNHGNHGNNENHRNPRCKPRLPQTTGLDIPDLLLSFVFFLGGGGCLRHSYCIVVAR